jgi:hypothetical protein
MNKANTDFVSFSVDSRKYHLLSKNSGYCQNLESNRMKKVWYASGYQVVTGVMPTVTFVDSLLGFDLRLLTARVLLDRLNVAPKNRRAARCAARLPRKMSAGPLQDHTAPP